MSAAPALGISRAAGDIIVMGVSQSSSSASDSSCFGMMPIDVMTSKFSLRVPAFLPEPSEFETPPPRKFDSLDQPSSSPSRKHIMASSVDDDETDSIQEELVAIHEKAASREMPSNEFFLLDPRKLGKTAAAYVVSDDDASPRTTAATLPMAQPSASNNTRADEERSSEASSGFIPIREGEDDKVEPELIHASSSPTTRRFQLQPRKSRRTNDYKFTW